MKIKWKYILVAFLLMLGGLFLHSYRPIRNFIAPPSPWPGTTLFRTEMPKCDSTKKTVFIVADSKLTELFDMLAPFYLFNATDKANVYIVAKGKTPIWIREHLFVCPQLTFSEADSLHLPADVIVIPALSIRDEHQDTTVIAWIKKHVTTATNLLTICDGASTGAATGLYDGKVITCHASDFDGIKKHFSRPVWIQDVTVARAGNLFSTAGVSNAVEGSLAVIENLFGSETSRKVAMSVNYPHEEIKWEHQSIAVSGGNIFAAVKKVFFRRNRDIGILLEDGIDELKMATILDTYGRTFPRSFRTFILKDSSIQTKYGLELICTGKNDVRGLDELHVVMPESFSREDSTFFRNIKTVRYDKTHTPYLFTTCLENIGEQYGPSFEKFVGVSLDYNQ